MNLVILLSLVGLAAAEKVIKVDVISPKIQTVVSCYDDESFNEIKEGDGSGRKRHHVAKRVSTPDTGPVRVYRNCDYPKTVPNYSLDCKTTNADMQCRQTCMFGYTLPMSNSQMSSYRCDRSSGTWTPNFPQECKPFIDCHVTLGPGGSKKCWNNFMRQGNRCQISCKAYGSYSYVPENYHTCDINGQWSPLLPHCAVSKSNLLLVARPATVIDYSNPSVSGKYLQQKQGPYLQQKKGPYLQQTPGPYLQVTPGPYLQQTPGPYLQQKKGPYFKVPKVTPIPHLQQKQGPYLQQTPGPHLQQTPGLYLQQTQGPYLKQKQGPYFPQMPGPYFPQMPGPYFPQAPGPYFPQAPGLYLQVTPAPYLQQKQGPYFPMMPGPYMPQPGQPVPLPNAGLGPRYDE